MKIRERIGLSAMLTLVLVVAVILAPSMGANPDANQTKYEKALEYILQKHGIPKERLIITNEREANFSSSNQKKRRTNG